MNKFKLGLFISNLILLISLATANLAVTDYSLVLAQSTTDSIQLSTATPKPLSTVGGVYATSTNSGQLSPTMVWQARLVDVIPNATLGGGAIVRVLVKDRAGIQITVQQGETVLYNTAGSKAEYGPFAAEFAPIPGGQWLVSVPSLDVSLSIETDYNSLFVIEFAPIPAAQATAIAQGSATPTPLGGVLWQGTKTREIEGPSIAGVLLRVKIENAVGIPIDIRTTTDFIGQAVTGSKAEDLAVDVAEFAGLSEGRYTIIPHGLNTQLTLDLHKNTTVFVEFKPVQAPTATPTATPRPPTAPPPPTATPLPTATPKTRWVTSVEQRTKINQSTSHLMVRVKPPAYGVAPISNVITVIKTDGTFQTNCSLRPRAELEQYRCEISNLQSGEYKLEWAAADLTAIVWLNNKELVTVILEQALAPLENTVWQGTLIQNSNTPYYKKYAESIINVEVKERSGEVVVLHNATGEQEYCETNAQYHCQFNNLKAGVYQLKLINLGATYSLYVDGLGIATLIFAETVTDQPLETATAIIGWGAIPKEILKGIGFIAATPTATYTPSPSPTPLPTSTHAPTRAATATTRPQATPTPLPPTETATPEAAYAWIGRIAERFGHPGQTIVVRVPLLNHPISIKSGSWQTEGLSGSKPEHGDFAMEFAGLSPGAYTIGLDGLGETTIELNTEEFVLIQFNYEIAPTTTPTPQPGQWTAAILRNSSGSEDGGGVSSILTLEVAGTNNLPIVVSTDGFETSCITGTKPELGNGVCQIGGLWPATYHIQPQGVPIKLDVTMDGRGEAHVAFWQN